MRMKRLAVPARRHIITFFIIHLVILGTCDSFSPSSRLQRSHRRSTRCFSQQQDEANVISVDDSAPSTAPTRLLPLARLSVVALPLLVALTAGVAKSLAIDLPIADIFHLNLPNPLADADPRYFLAGGICAATSHGITTPIDVVKTRQQADPERYTGGVLGAASAIIKEDGPSTLLSGLAPTVLGYGVEGACKFGVYESLKPEFARLLDTSTNTIPYLLASVAAGGVASVLLCPMERTRIRLVTDPDFADGLVSGVQRLVDESGVGSLFYGLTAMLSKQVPYTFAQQVSFDVVATMLYAAAANANFATADVKIEISALAALSASIVACIMSHPGDVLLTTTYKNTKAESFGTVVNTVFERNGLAGFFTGLPARFVHVGAIMTSQLVLYDFIKQLLGLPATGTH